MKKTILKFAVAITLVAFIGVSCAKDDTEVPTITLKGEKEMSATLGAKFTDPGATANDNKDGDMTKQITVVNSFTDANGVIVKAGAQTIVYKVTDEAGNSTSSTRTVKVSAEPLSGKYDVVGKIEMYDATGVKYKTEDLTWTEEVTKSDVLFNKIIISTFSGYTNLNIDAIAEGNNIVINEPAKIAKWFDTEAEGPAKVATTGTTSVFTVTGATPISAIVKLDYKISHPDGRYEVVTTTYTKK